MSEKNASRVLIVDDARINRMILSSLLASNGISADLAEGGQECLDLCQENNYDLILLDHRMPEIDGVDTLVQLKQLFRKTGREIPIVCHTTEDARNNINLYKAAGFADVLIKPIDPKLLSEILMTYLPEGESPDKERLEADEHAKLEKELDALPDWLSSIDGINPAYGIEHCETAEDYLDALSVFSSSIHEKADEIQKFIEEGNWKMYTLRVHSLKSMSRLIGAGELSELAADLEYAGKVEDIDTLIKRTPELLAKYRNFAPLLSRLLSDEDDDALENTGQTLPEVPEETLQDAYRSLADFVSCYDADSVRMVLASLRGYRLSRTDTDILQSIDSAISKADWEKARDILQNKD